MKRPWVSLGLFFVKGAGCFHWRGSGAPQISRCVWSLCMALHGGLKTNNVRVEESTRCFQYTASPVQTSRPKDGYAGTGQAAFPTNDGIAGMGS